MNKGRKTKIVLTCFQKLSKLQNGHMNSKLGKTYLNCLIHEKQLKNPIILEKGKKDKMVKTN